MHSFENIIERMRTAIGVYTDQDLAKYLGIAKTSVSSWRARQNIPRKHLDCIARNMRISYEWLLTGEGDMSLPPPPLPTNLRYLQPKKSAGIAADPTEEELEREQAAVIAAVSNVAGLDAAELLEVFIKLPRSKQKKILGNALEEHERQGDKGDRND